MGAVDGPIVEVVRLAASDAAGASSSGQEKTIAGRGQLQGGQMQALGRVGGEVAAAVGVAREIFN